jgi:hypothetical protein
MTCMAYGFGSILMVWTSTGRRPSAPGWIALKPMPGLGDPRARTILAYAARALDQLRNLPEPPARDSETATLRWVRQSRRYPLWRVSHAYDPEVAVRLICWFPPDTGTVVVALFAADKARLGDVFYDGVAARADPLIDQWKRETAYEEEA